MKEYNREIDIHTIYIDEYFRYDTAIQMNVLSYTNIGRANLLIKLPQLEQFLQKMKNGTFDTKVDGLAALAIIQHEIFDKILIVTCIENYFKAILLIKGYLVHQIKPNQSDWKILGKKQKTIPIKKEELFTTTDDLPKYNEILSKNTVNMSWILQPDYAVLYEIEDDIIGYIRELNDRRNALHFHSDAGMQLSDKEITMIKSVRKLIKCNLAYFQNSLIQKMAPHSPIRLTPECY